MSDGTSLFIYLKINGLTRVHKLVLACVKFNLYGYTSKALCLLNVTLTLNGGMSTPCFYWIILSNARFRQSLAGSSPVLLRADDRRLILEAGHPQGPTHSDELRGIQLHTQRNPALQEGSPPPHKGEKKSRRRMLGFIILEREFDLYWYLTLFFHINK